MTQVASLAEWDSLHAKAGNKAVRKPAASVNLTLHDGYCAALSRPELSSHTLDKVTFSDMHTAT